MAKVAGPLLLQFIGLESNKLECCLAVFVQASQTSTAPTHPASSTARMPLSRSVCTGEATDRKAEARLLRPVVAAALLLLRMSGTAAASDTGSDSSDITCSPSCEPGDVRRDRAHVLTVLNVPATALPVCWRGPRKHSRCDCCLQVRLRLSSCMVTAVSWSNFQTLKAFCDLARQPFFPRQMSTQSPCTSITMPAPCCPSARAVALHVVKCPLLCLPAPLHSQISTDFSMALSQLQRPFSACSGRVCRNSKNGLRAVVMRPQVGRSRSVQVAASGLPIDLTGRPQA